MKKSANLLHKCGLGDSDMSSTVSMNSADRHYCDQKQKKM